jgi:hypothetical protein
MGLQGYNHPPFVHLRRLSGPKLSDTALEAINRHEVRRSISTFMCFGNSISDGRGSRVRNRPWI